MEGAAKNATAPPSRKPVVVLYPTPGMGHLFAMVELGRTLSARGLLITVLVVDAPYDTGAPSRRVLAGVSAANPSISFHRLPAAAAVPSSSSKHHEGLTMEAVRAHNPQLRAFLVAAAPSPPVLVVDMFCGSALDVAAELGVPTYFFFTSGAATLAFFLHLPVLHAAGRSFRDMGAALVRVPGVPPFPATHAIHAVMERDDAAYAGFMDASAALCRSRGVIVNTFRSLEPSAVDAVAAGICTPPGVPTPPVHCIGPLIKSRDHQNVWTGSGEECLAWLDQQPGASVVFLCFGGLGRFSAAQTREVAAGLEASGHRFLWVVRAPPADDPAMKFDKPPEPDLDALLPEGFMARTRDRGLVVKSWAPQQDVLAHGSVGGFVTHCGWNSVLEAVMAGVPMLAWPLYAEQRLNRWFLEKELQLTVALEGCDTDKGLVTAEEVAAKMRWLMDSEGGTLLRERMLAVTGRAKEALRKGGESETALARLVDSWRST